MRERRTKGTALSREVVERVDRLLTEADHVLITAGAGMSVDAGFDYTDERQFGRRYPRMAERGPRCRYHVFGYPWPSEAVQWGHLARHLQELRFQPPPNPTPYLQLCALTAHRDRFVLTSNADDLFERSGFDPSRIWTRQGSYSRLQCLARCHDDATWPAEQWVRAALPCVDLATEELVDATLVPRCPRCGGRAMLNVRGGDWFIDKPYQPQAHRLRAWLDQAASGRLLVLDVGSGFNTPPVVRWPAEEIAHRHADAHLVRVNRDHPAVPAELGARALSLACAGAPLWAALTERAAVAA
ncbi:MAG: NAD-dependent protein deacetylase of SIR2 family [Deltaproteobacteria bacterium]|nr:NAD-dependent protein deacetylase of SIR2 family [Deltaproteobacteria bacterium]